MSETYDSLVQRIVSEVKATIDDMIDDPDNYFLEDSCFGFDHTTSSFPEVLTEADRKQLVINVANKLRKDPD